VGWGRLDGKFAGHRKRRLASLAADGLLARAISHAAEHETDGFVDEAWVRQQDGWRAALKVALDVGLLEPLPANTTRELVGGRLPGIRPRAIAVTAGPFAVAGFLVHDYLDFNPSAEEQDEKRASGRRKKRDQRAKPRLWNGDPATMSPDPSPASRDAGLGGGTTESNEEQQDHSRAQAPGLIGEVMTILRRCSRLSVPDHCEPAIESAIAGAPGKDPVAAAHTAVTWASDPAWRKTWGPSVLGDALRKQEPGVKAKGDQSVLRSERTCARCKVAKVPPGYGAYCEKCSEELAA
jgi:hypothetical protein